MREIEGMQVASELADFIETKALPGTGVNADRFWAGLAGLVNGMGDENRALLRKRETIQAQIDAWHQERRGQPHDAAAYTAVLQEIGYLVPENGDFQIETAGVDPEIAKNSRGQLA